ncbi:TnsA endonuclease N-terminal domain-containing protein [Pseudomonas sp. MAHUQ-62]|uniref:TnsA endonuclease N-terminal domain-containing protein n=1 Tax=Pseudomonas sp. GCM10023245 TaxID=3252652 RepID=UPI003610781F
MLDLEGIGGNEVSRRRFRTEADIDRAIRDGYGQGAGLDYKPWLRVRDVPSKGQSKKTLGLTVPRIYQLFSQNEYFYFLTLEFAKSVVDIREQFPLLPTKETEAAALSLGYAHPKFTGTQLNYVMTTDFLITKVDSSGREVLKARTVKEDAELYGAKARRIDEKLKIEQVFWEGRGVDWKLVTKEVLFENYFARNLEWIKRGAIVEPELKSYVIQRRFLHELSECLDRDWTIDQALKHVSKRVFVPLVGCRRIYLNLLWEKIIKTDLKSELLSWSLDLPEFEFDLTAVRNEKTYLEAGA